MIACTSFHPRKVLTTGEGGACLCDDDALAERLRILRNHGQRAPGQFVCAAGNQRMTELAAAIGSAQLAKLERLVAERRRLAGLIRAAFPEGAFQRPPAAGEANEQTLGLLVGAEGRGSGERERVLGTLRARGVQAGALSYALPELPQFAAAASAAQRQGRSLQQAREIAARGLALPLYPSMTASELAQVIEALGEALGR